MLEKRELLKVQKPSIYAGVELNQITPRFSDREVRFVLTYPDLYEVGMSHVGGKILWHVINNLTDFALMHRAYLPRPDMQKIMEEKGIPLYTIEEKIPVKNYDLWGFSLSSELTYTNVLRCMKLAQIPIKSEERQTFPVIFAGGPCAFNPLPLSSFVDFFCIGDGEELLLQIAEIFRKVKKSGASKEDFLFELKNLEGIWVPKFGKYPVKKAVFHVLKREFFPTFYPVPCVETSQDRMAIEVSRGCLQGCRFCQAGYIYRPYRERSIEDVLELTKKTFLSTGYEEVSLVSLSVSDYSRFEVLVQKVMDFCQKTTTALSLPSMRVKDFNPELAIQIMRVKKTGFTLAPETGSDELRARINKDLTNDDLYRAVFELVKRGWGRIKLYFMIGLPFEKEEDVLEITKMLKEIDKLIEKFKCRKSLSASISVFVPKPFTPFQWKGFADSERIREIKGLILKNSPRSFKIKIHDYRQSLIEALLARGDEKTGELLLKSFENDCFLDGWKEFFNWKGWLKSFEEAGFDVDSVLDERKVDSELPWEFIKGVVEKRFLLEELVRAELGIRTPNCRETNCHGCGACSPEDLKRLKNLKRKKEPFSIPAISKKKKTKVYKYAVCFEKKFPGSLLSNLDVLRVFSRLIRSCGFPLKYSEGFSPHPKISIAFPPPLGVESELEVAEVSFEEEINADEFAESLNKRLPEGLKVLRVFPLKEGSVLDLVKEIEYRISPIPESLKAEKNDWIKEIKVSGKEVILKVKVVNRETLGATKIFKLLSVSPEKFSIRRKVIV